MPASTCYDALAVQDALLAHDLNDEALPIGVALEAATSGYLTGYEPVIRASRLLLTHLRAEALGYSSIEQEHRQLLIAHQERLLSDKAVVDELSQKHVGVMTLGSMPVTGVVILLPHRELEVSELRLLVGAKIEAGPSGLVKRQELVDYDTTERLQCDVSKLSLQAQAAVFATIE